MQCLWLARTLPFPLTAGDRIYSANLAASLATAGAAVTYAGLSGQSAPESVQNISWRTVNGAPRRNLPALLSSLPLVAARYATKSYHKMLRQIATSSNWDAVLLDGYAAGWALDLRSAFPKRTIFVYVAHNHEESMSATQWHDRGASLSMRGFMLQNHLKTRRLEHRMVNECNLITAITDADATLFKIANPKTPVLVLSPGYNGPRASFRVSPRRRSVIMFGSYHWSAKQANLRVFFEQADATLFAAKIEVVLVGDMPTEFGRWIEKRYRSARVVGYVDDPTSYLAEAQLALLAEPIGGGFKLKNLAYIFNRVPVVALQECAVGLPPSVCEHMVLCPNIASLITTVTKLIDDESRLQSMQHGAFIAADHFFDWADRGRLLKTQIEQLVNTRSEIDPGVPKSIL
jgi:hypothetical protein